MTTKCSKNTLDGSVICIICVMYAVKLSSGVMDLARISHLF